MALTEQRVASIDNAIPLTTDPSVIEANALMATALATQEIQNYAGIAPVTELSGQKSWVHWRWQCAKFVRQTFVEWAAKTVNSSYWARLYYQGLREKGKSHQSAIRALAFKWIRIIYRCWKTRIQYDEAKYLLALEARHSPLLRP